MRDNQSVFRILSLDSLNFFAKLEGHFVHDPN